MTNKEIAATFNKLAGLMELHNENPFKIKSYSSAYITLRKWGEPIIDMDPESIGQIKGIGKSVQSKIKELIETGQIAALEEYKAKTPEGIQQMLGIRGFGPKKIKVVWKELGIETPGELVYACMENRLIDLKGFGEKTQRDLLERLEYFLQSDGQQLYANMEGPAEELMNILSNLFSDARLEFTGAYRRKAVTLSYIDFITDAKERTLDDLENIASGEQANEYIYKEKYTFRLFYCAKDNFGSKWFATTGSDQFVSSFQVKNEEDEMAIFNTKDISFVVPEQREYGLSDISSVPENELISVEDIRGVVHNHSTWSDGLQSIREMALACMEKGYEYLVMSDHSKSAFYANGLKEESLYKQWAEIDALNAEFGDFKILKSIESDILTSGELDYEDDVLAQFDLVIASIHSNFRMDESKATARLIRAIENEHTSILGHPTGRLLLSRKGYPIDHKKIIDACSANGTAIEINANPYRLDLDWSWIPYAVDKGVYISINPDAHSIAGIDDIKYGVFAARKGGLPKDMCLNAKPCDQFMVIVK